MENYVIVLLLGKLVSCITTMAHVTLVSLRSHAGQVLKLLIQFLCLAILIIAQCLSILLLLLGPELHLNQFMGVELVVNLSCSLMRL